jgi:hypothetical protein
MDVRKKDPTAPLPSDHTVLNPVISMGSLLTQMIDIVRILGPKEARLEG